jgi:hypothetical protein
MTCHAYWQLCQCCSDLTKHSNLFHFHSSEASASHSLTSSVDEFDLVMVRVLWMWPLRAGSGALWRCDWAIHHRCTRLPALQCMPLHGDVMAAMRACTFPVLTALQLPLEPAAEREASLENYMSTVGMHALEYVSLGFCFGKHVIVCSVIVYCHCDCKTEQASVSTGRLEQLTRYSEAPCHQLECLISRHVCMQAAF